MMKKEWIFDTKDEALAKLVQLKNMSTYEVVQHREHGNFAKGWVLRKLT